jgi:hypothetical protein
METKFQRLPPVFVVKIFNGANADSVGQIVQPEIQHCGSNTEVPLYRAVVGTKNKFQRLLLHCLAPLMLAHVE